MVHRDKILYFLVLLCCFAHTPLQAQQPRKKVGLVLGGGGAKGAAEVGVLGNEGEIAEHALCEYQLLEAVNLFIRCV